MDSDLLEALTQREIEVLWLLEARLSSEEIAEVLNLPPWAAQSYRSRIEQKLTLRLLSPHVPERGSPDGSPP